MINSNMAWKIRADRGLMLPPDAEYTFPRLAQIAKMQSCLIRRLEALDNELKELAMQYRRAGHDPQI
jgi:hypothetical protein